jgi:hypothetical protein
MSRFELQLERERFKAGETVTGSVLVVEGGGSRALGVSLTYNEKTEDFFDVVTSTDSGALHEGDLAAGMSFAFELMVPIDALPNYESEHGELYWELDVKSDEAGRDTHERRRIEVEATPARTER